MNIVEGEGWEACVISRWLKMYRLHSVEPQQLLFGEVFEKLCLNIRMISRWLRL